MIELLVVGLSKNLNMKIKKIYKFAKRSLFILLPLYAVVAVGYTTLEIKDFITGYEFAQAEVFTANITTIEGFEDFFNAEVEKVKEMESFKSYIHKEAEFVVTTKLESNVYDKQQALSRQN